VYALAFVCVAAITASAQAQRDWEPLEPVKTAGMEGAGAFSYDDYAHTLATYVDEMGMVYYKGLKENRAKLDAFVASMGQLDRSTLDTWTEPEQIAFWINAYNAITLRSIIDHYPIKASFGKSLLYPKNSIRQISGVWKKKTWLVTGREMTLDEIEHKVLRKQYDEPRIHVALVCAAMGCPPLLAEPYDGDRLDEQFADRTERFLDNPLKFRIEADKKRVYLSPIFKWFGEDFLNNYGTEEEFSEHSERKRAVLNFVKDFVSDESRHYLETEEYSLKFESYDWSLNERTGPSVSRP
jgi:hypothetical protein